jgi:hypothetical protein
MKLSADALEEEKTLVAIFGEDRVVVHGSEVRVDVSSDDPGICWLVVSRGGQYPTGEGTMVKLESTGKVCQDKFTHELETLLPSLQRRHTVFIYDLVMEATKFVSFIGSEVSSDDKVKRKKKGSFRSSFLMNKNSCCATVVRH